MSDELDIWIHSAQLQADDKEKVVEDTIKQVKKDFALQGIELETNKLLKADLVYSFSVLLDYMEFLHDSRLPALLYQLDLKESEISYKLTSSKPEESYKVLAESILKRCFEKVMWRRKFQSGK
jgi:hypothetical protein